MRVPGNEVDSWVQTIYYIKVSVLDYCVYRSSLEGASNRLVDFVLSCLQEEKVAHPSGMEEMLKDLLGNGEKLEFSLHKPAHTTPEKFENATMTGHFGFCV